MIKLNSKNITYVALADSNNSLKAPKEIWYADSNNSVKLVYRRKDALIEGEDYEKYHWLKGDGSSYINTLKLIESDSEVRCVIIPTSDDTKWKYIYANDPSDIASTFMCVLLKDNSTLHFRHKRGNITFAINTEYECVHSIDSVKVNNEVLTPVSESKFQESDVPLYLFSAPTIPSTSNLLFDGYIKYVTLSDKLNLIPCKLLKPVPKWLDANGIRRQVGECGMIDLVSGKFYGNVNSVGTFTVENYYERKEWLVANIYDTTGESPMCDLPINSDTFEFRIIMQSENPLNIGHIKSSNYFYFSYTLTEIKVWNIENRTVDFVSNIGSNDMTFKSTPSEFTINNIQVTKYGFPAKYKTFYNNRTNGDAIVCNSSIFVDNKERYIPCTLTMDLPASMDANNIARTKGTSGMWDLVSDKFYGNVANSGTFKAVNLAEGVDYEVYDWLVGDGTAYIDTNIKISETDIITTKFIALTIPIHHHLIYGTNSGNLNNITLVVFSNNRINFRPTSPEYSFVFNTNTEYETVQSATSINVNGSQVWQGNSTFEESQYSCYVFATASSHINYMFDGKISKFIISDKINLIPVKLLRSIPAKYDANGIARQAGECGMYDTVNDVFYGNVASSGSFTCVNDS